MSTDPHKKFVPQELVKDNQELKDICFYLDDTRQRSKRLAKEWQSFGKYTASVLRNEVLEFETKVSILQEKLEKLSKENAELRDLCLFLNQMPGSSAASSSTPGPKLQSTTEQSGHPYAIHAACVTEVNATLAGSKPPKYTGFTGEARLEDNAIQHETEGIKEKNQSDPKGYVHQLEQRLERLEQEKLELIKSLSAAHILATSTDETKDIQIPESSTIEESEDFEHPPNIKAFVDFISDDKDADQSTNTKLAQQFSSDDIVKLSTLVDVSHRVSDLNCNPTTQPHEAVETAILQALLNASWMQLKNKFVSKRKSKTSGKTLIHDKVPPPEKKSDISPLVGVALPQQQQSQLQHIKTPPTPPAPPPPPPQLPSARGIPSSHTSTVPHPPKQHQPQPNFTKSNTNNGSARILRTQL